MQAQPEKKVTQLSALILMIFAEQTRKDSSFEASGYDITRIIEELRLNFSHQQIYREMSKISLLEKEHVPQEGKPDKNNRFLADKSKEAIENIHQHINFDPKKTSLKMFLGFNHLGAATEAYKAILKFTSDFVDAESKFKSKLEKSGTRTDFDDTIYKLDLVGHEALLNALENHMIKLAYEQLNEDEAKSYILNSVGELAEGVSELGLRNAA
ncbi:hypothetical protein KW882_01015 [Vibrio parahaemolyticus]